MQPHDKAGITLTEHSPWVWHAYLHGEHVGTVSGDGVDGFTARDIDQRSIGHGYVSAEAAMQAWADPPDGQSSVTYPPGAFHPCSDARHPTSPGSGGEGWSPWH
jgi:hypothetical protein